MFPVDENGYEVCPLKRWESIAHDEGQSSRWSDCLAMLHLSQSFGTPLGARSFDPKDAYTSMWKVECENGHVLAESDGSNDTAPAFDFVSFIEGWVATPTEEKP